VCAVARPGADHRRDARGKPARAGRRVVRFRGRVAPSRGGASPAPARHADGDGRGRQDPPGVGGGALAADEFRDGVWLVERAPLAEPTSVALAVAATLSIQPRHGATVVKAIADWLRGRRLLLILVVVGNLKRMSV